MNIYQKLSFSSEFITIIYVMSQFIATASNYCFKTNEKIKIKIQLQSNILKDNIIIRIRTISISRKIRKMIYEQQQVEGMSGNGQRKEGNKQQQQRKQSDYDYHRMNKSQEEVMKQNSSLGVSIQSQNTNREAASSDEEYTEQSKYQAKPTNSTINQEHNQNDINNEDVMDQTQQVRSNLNRQQQKQVQTLQQIIKEQFSQQQQESKHYEQTQVASERQTQEKVTNKEQSKVQTQPILHKQKSQHVKNQQRVSHLKMLRKSMTLGQVGKYLQPNSAQLFVSGQSMLPNEIICIENSLTRVVLHMNKKIVPIPSSFLSDSAQSRKSVSPQPGKATLPSVQCPYLLGKLIVTNYKLTYMDSLYPNTMTFSLPLNYIFKLQRTSQQSTGLSYIQVWFKTGLSIKLKYHQQQFTYSQKIKDIILTLMHKNLYAAVDLGLQLGNGKVLCKGYGVRYFDQKSIRKTIQGMDAQVVDNDSWKQVLGYPEKFVVPLGYLERRNADARLVVLSYAFYVQSQKVGLWRTGPGNPDPCQEQWISKAKLSNKHQVIQIKNKGIGISKSQAQRSVQIQNLYILRQSYQKVHQLTYHSHQSSKWLMNMCGTRWYEQIAFLMNQAQYIIQVLSSKVNVTLLCDTEARGAQVCAIIQLLMNPFYRTLQGFPFLIEKQFLHFACPKVAKKQRQEDKTIIIIQFLDCVYQFTHLYPLSFQFNQHYLVYLAQHVFSNKYGNFLYVTRQLKNESQRRQIVEKCVCIWEDIKMKIQTDKKTFFQLDELRRLTYKKSNKKINASPPIHQLINYYIYFKNSFYIDHNESNIFQLRNHNQVSKGIKLWSLYFFKKVYGCQSLKQQILFCNQIEKRYLKIAYEHNMMKKSNQIMRKRLSEQFSLIAQKKQILKSIKEM